MADKMIVSDACRHKNALQSEIKSPMLSNICELEIDSTTAKEAAVEEAEAA